MVKVLKLTTGEEIVGDVEINSDKFTIKKPCALQLVPSRTNPEQPMMALIPYAPYTENHSILVDRNHIVWCEPPLKELYNQYNSIFGTGLVVPN